MYVGGAAVLLTLGLIGVVQLSEYNQMRAKCAELESEIRDSGEELVLIGERLQRLEDYAEADPWGAFGYLGEAMELTLTTAGMVGELKTQVVTYDETCPAKRAEAFRQSPAMKRIGERLDQLAN